MGLIVLLMMWATDRCMLWQEPEYIWTEPEFFARYAALNFG